MTFSVDAATCARHAARTRLRHAHRPVRRLVRQLALAAVVLYGLVLIFAVAVAVLLAGRTVFPWGPGCVRGREQTRVDAATLRAAAVIYLVEDGENAHCPTLDDLEEGGILVDQPILDGWGKAFEIVCDVDRLNVTVVSAGPDGEFGTGDDIE